METLNNLNIIISFIRNLYHIGVTTADSNDIVEKFCAQNRLHTIQGLFNTDRLEVFLANLESKRIYHVTGALQIHTVIFKLESIPVIIGPFCPLIMTADDCRLLLGSLGISNISPEELLAYRDRFPVLSETEVINIGLSILNTLKEDNSPPEFEVVQYKSEGDNSETEEVFTNYNSMIEEHYQVERRFMAAVVDGDKNKALEYLDIQQRAFQSFKRLGTTLENERIGAAIVRTMLRCAAINTGLPALENDVLSRRNTLATRRASKVEEILKAKQIMVAEYADAMKLHKYSSNSNLTFKIIRYIENRYQRNLTIDSMAKDIGYTPNYIITLFRKETGYTPAEYLRKYRTQKAATLLIETNLRVEDIADKVGISDANYFVKQFKKDYGMTPSEYRRKNHL